HVDAKRSEGPVRFFCCTRSVGPTDKRPHPRLVERTGCWLSFRRRPRFVETVASLRTPPALSAELESAVASKVAQKSYVLDTSVLLSDPKAPLRFAEHEVILPIVVISELEKKRHDAELGYYARSALRLLDSLRVRYGSLNQPVPLNDEGGHLLVELNHITETVLPAGFRQGDNDSRILAVAKNFADEGRTVTVVSKDLPMRVKASAMGLAADEYRNEWVTDTGWTGLAEVDATDGQISELYD